MATSWVLSMIRKVTSSSILLRLLMRVDLMSMLVSGGIINTAAVALGSAIAFDWKKAFPFGFNFDSVNSRAVSFVFVFDYSLFREKLAEFN